MPDVILLGDINVDISASLPAYPACGGEGVANAIEYHTGGSVVNTAIALSAMGVKVGLIGRIGRDVMADKIIADLEKANIDCSCIQVDSVVSTGLIYIVFNLDGERTMFSARGANAFTEPDEAIDDYFIDSRWYHFSGYALLAEPQKNAALYALKQARRQRCLVSLDPGPEPAMRYGKHLKALLPEIDIFLPNEQELIALTGGAPFRESIQEILDAGGRAIVVKRGRKGCVIAYDDVYIDIPAFEIQAKNTTGAGDSFGSGLILGRMVGLSWAASGVLGNAMGGLASTGKGSGADEWSPHHVIDLIEKDMLKSQWEDLFGFLDEALAYLSGLRYG